MTELEAKLAASVAIEESRKSGEPVTLDYDCTLQEELRAECTLCFVQKCWKTQDAMIVFYDSDWTVRMRSDWDVGA